MGILDGIVDWLATQVMNLLDLASTSVLGALGCNMDTFKRYFPAASAMYEIFIWTLCGSYTAAMVPGLILIPKIPSIWLCVL